MKVLTYDMLKTYDKQMKNYIDETNANFVEVVDSYDTTLLSGSWTGDSAPYIYDLEIEEKYNFEVTLPNSVTIHQIEALQSACIMGSGNDNLLRAFGEKPTIDIPVIIKKWTV